MYSASVFNFAQTSPAIVRMIMNTGVQSFLPLLTTSGPGPRPGKSGRGLFGILGTIEECWPDCCRRGNVEAMPHGKHEHELCDFAQFSSPEYALLRHAEESARDTRDCSRQWRQGPIAGMHWLRHRDGARCHAAANAQLSHAAFLSLPGVQAGCKDRRGLTSARHDNNHRLSQFRLRLPALDRTSKRCVRPGYLDRHCAPVAQRRDAPGSPYRAGERRWRDPA